MYDHDALKKLAERRATWERQLDDTGQERPGPFITTSGTPIARVYDPTDIADLDYERDLGLPGEYPFTRGVHPTGYRGKLWTMRMFAGFGTAEETNARFKYLLEHGQTGLSIAFDLPHAVWATTPTRRRRMGEFGKCGVARHIAARHGDPARRHPARTRSPRRMTINSPAAIIWAMYIAAAEKQGVPPAKLARHAAERHPQGVHRAEGVHLPAGAVDAAGHRHDRVRRRSTCRSGTRISISGYHIREAGSTAAQELAFTLADGLEYVRWALARGLDIDDFAPRLCFFFNATTTSSRRSPSTAPRAASGRARCARRSARRIRARGCCASTRRRPGAQPDRAAAGDQHRARGDPGAGRGAGRHAEPAHQQHGRSAGAAQREGGRRSRCARSRSSRTRSASTNTVDPLGGSFFVEALTDRDGAASATTTSRRIDGDGRRDPGDRGGLLPARDRRRGVPLPARDRQPRAHHRRRQRLRHRRAARDPDPADGPGRRATPVATAPPRSAGRATVPRRPARCALSRRHAAARPTSCRPCSTPSAPTAPWARSAG